MSPEEAIRIAERAGIGVHVEVSDGISRVAIERDYGHALLLVYFPRWRLRTDRARRATTKRIIRAFRKREHGWTLVVGAWTP